MQSIEDSQTSSICLICKAGTVAPDIEVYLHPERRTRTLRCQSCDSSYLAPPISEEDISLCYASEYHDAFSKSLKKNFIKGALLGKQLKAWRPEGRFLDVGCALGAIVAGVSYKSGWEGYGTEISAHAIELGKNLFPQVHYFQGTIENLPDSTPPFDNILVNNVLEHVPDPEAFLKRVYKFLKPGGRLQLIVPNGPIDISPNRIIYRSDGIALLTKHGGHLFFFSRKGLKSILTEVGFNILSWKTFHFKEALKACGYIPGRIGRFRKKFLPARVPPTQPSAIEPLLYFNFEIPSNGTLNRQFISDKIRRPFRYFSDFGYDFDLLAERPE